MNLFKSLFAPKRPCKSPDEIELLLRSFETKYTNLKKRTPDQGLSMRQRDILIRLEAKIHIMKVILKLK